MNYQWQFFVPLNTTDLQFKSGF